MSRELTANWLRQNIARYQNKDRLYADVLAALDRYPSLRPKTDVYTFDDGRTQLLLCIHGLLPISYRSASYNIPIAIWLVLSYPAVAPLVYVVPTSDMLVKPSSQVDHSGRCNLEYLTHWSRKPEAHSLILLLEAMQSYFSNDPPLYAKLRPKPSARPPSIATPAISSPSAVHSSAPSDRGHVTHTPDPSLPPRLPPKPFSTGPGAVVTPGSSSSHILKAAASPSSAISAPPYRPPPDLLDEDDLNSTLAPNPVGTEIAPPPPRPPNPQTVALHNALHSSFRDALSRMATSHTDALARQRAAQAELLVGPEAIRDESARLVAVRDVCRAVGDRWDALIADGERALAEMRRRGEVGVDEMVCASSIVGNQLVNLVAEDNAIEDTTYHLHRALVSGRIDLERFLRTTRVLAEEQFMKRALVEKILRGLPMGIALR